MWNMSTLHLFGFEVKKKNTQSFLHFFVLVYCICTKRFLSCSLLYVLSFDTERGITKTGKQNNRHSLLSYKIVKKGQ